jgi:hypothetical protein
MFRRINSVTYRRIRYREDKRYITELEEELTFYLNIILKDTGIEITQLFQETGEDINLQFIEETGNSLN